MLIYAFLKTHSKIFFLINKFKCFAHTRAYNVQAQFRFVSLFVFVVLNKILHRTNIEPVIILIVEILRVCPSCVCLQAGAQTVKDSKFLFCLGQLSFLTFLLSSGNILGRLTNILPRAVYSKYFLLLIVGTSSFLHAV